MSGEGSFTGRRCCLDELPLGRFSWSCYVPETRWIRGYLGVDREGTSDGVSLFHAWASAGSEALFFGEAGRPVMCSWLVLFRAVR